MLEELSRKTIDDDAVCRLLWPPQSNDNVAEETQTGRLTTAVQLMRYQTCPSLNLMGVRFFKAKACPR